MKRIEKEGEKTRRYEEEREDREVEKRKRMGGWEGRKKGRRERELLLENK